MAIRNLRHVFAVTLCALLAIGSLHAASFTYSDQAKRIKAGVLLTEGFAAVPASRPNPYVFYVMDQRADMKPSGWEFYNPMAPSHVTSEIANRWAGLCNAGDTVNKSMGCYWEVNMSDITPDDLAQYDVLLLSGYWQLTFRGRDREKLRKFVDNGGVLWIDYQQKPLFLPLKTVLDTTFFLPTTAFKDDGAGIMVPADIPPLASAQALLNRPFLISGSDANLLGGSRDATTVAKVYIEFAGEAQSSFMPIVTRAGKIVVGGAQYGSGYVVITADGVAQAITNPVGESGAKCGDFFIAAHSEDLKLSYNIVNWGSESPGSRKNPRQTASSFEEVGMPLVSLWKYTAAAGGGKVVGSPVILDDMVFYIDGVNVLHAFDLSPIRDRDGDGNPDDGMADYSSGSPCDELWQAKIGEACSPPSAGYAPLGGGASPSVPAIFVVTKSGKVYGFNALDYTKSTPPTPQEYFTAPNDQLFPFADYDMFNGVEDDIPAPTYAEGSLYVGDGYGLLHAHDFISGGEWTCPKRMNTPSPTMVSHSPVIGYFHDPSSGATELVAHLAGRGVPFGGSASAGHIKSCPIRTYGEVLVKENTKDYRVRTLGAAFLTAPPEAFPRLWRTDPFGGPWAEMFSPADWTVPSASKFQLSDAAASIVNTNDLRVIADYRVDYLNSSPWRSIRVKNATTPVTYAGVSGPPVAAKNDTLYFGTENGSVYAVKESGKGTRNNTPLVVKWRWCFQDPIILAVTGGARFEIVGSPVIVNDMVYVAGNVPTGGSNYQGYLFAFKADPSFVLRLAQPIAPNTTVTLKQIDSVDKPAGPAIPFVAASDTDVDKANFDTVALVDYDTSKITVINFRSNSANGELTASADVVVQYVPASAVVPGQTPIPIDETHHAFDPNSGDSWNNLVWYMKIRGAASGEKITSSPSAMGDVLYMGCGDGSLVSVDLTEAGKPSSTIFTMGGVSEKAFRDITANPATGYVWTKQLVNLPNANAAILGSPAASHGMLAVATTDGLSIMYNPTRLVADGNRLVEIDSQGKPIWTCDSTAGYNSTLALGSSGAADQIVIGSVTMPFNRPSVARRAPVGGFIVADTGNNRIVHMDKGGTATWQITSFAEENPNSPVLPPGSPMELNKPTDVTCWMTTSPVVYNGNTVVLPIYHYLIADSGNNRVIEIRSKFDTAFGRYRNVVAQVSANLAEGAPRRFLTARLSEYNPATSVMTVICTMANSPENTGEHGLGSSLVKLDWSTGKLSGVTNRLPLGSTSPSAFKLLNPIFFNRQYVSNDVLTGKREYADVVIDASGVHVCYVNETMNVTSIRSYQFSDHWDTDESPAMNKLQIQVPGQPVGTTAPHPRPFKPVYAQYLPNGHVLVTNKATGMAYDKNGIPKTFTGEVFEMEPDPAAPAKYRRTPGTSIWHTAGFHQPLSAEMLLY